ncbi:MAG: hypothetical protein NZV14_01645 [Bryobacteraceae bacterium]|nr:hypothetical protein [Bryobacteraceae bacterium]MDW8376833.1 hypothetical protein [Bryobacterales bacterium]
MLLRRQFLASPLLLVPYPAWARSLKAGPIEFEVIRRGRSSRRYLHIHGNESTAGEVLRKHMETHLGVAFLIRNSERNIRFEGGELDPNRMFSEEGAQRNLKLLNGSWSPEKLNKALVRLRQHREKILRQILPPAGGLLVALHNNSRGYSVKSELADSDEVALNDESNPHEFFLATQVQDFRILARSPYNAVLQNRRPQVDDGSLSRLASARAVRYVNLEAGLGQFARQREMLDWLERNLP